MFKRWFSAILLCLIASCVSVPKGQPQSTASSYIEVDNGNWSDVIVYVFNNPSMVKLRVGYVGALSTTLIPLRSNYDNRDLTFLVQPFGGGRQWISDAVPHGTHEIIRLYIQPSIQMSYYGVFKN